jgi:hypothetical protein
MCAQWLLEETILERLAQDIEGVAHELRPPIQSQEAVVRQGDLPRHGQLAAADHDRLGDGVVGSPERARGDDGGAPTRQAGDTVNTSSLEGLGDGRMMRRRASLDLPAEGVLNMRFLGDRQRLDAQRGWAGKGHCCR